MKYDPHFSFKDRIIVAPTNKEVKAINKRVMELINSEEIVLNAIDIIDEPNEDEL
jgi:hypothetical protein